MARDEYKMYDNDWRRRDLFLVGIICLVSLSGIVFPVLVSFKRPVSHHASSPSSPKKVATKQSLSKVVNYGLPVRLKISKLAVDASITYMGTTKDGDMAVPTAITDVGWYKNGSLPGNKGSAVLAGHVDGARGQPGVFANLDKLQKGDVLQVIDSNSRTLSFTVKETRIYSEDAKPSEVFTTTGAAHLNLITCTGTWDNAQRHFLERLVVFTDKSS